MTHRVTSTATELCLSRASLYAESNCNSTRTRSRGYSTFWIGCPDQIFAIIAVGNIGYRCGMTSFGQRIVTRADGYGCSEYFML